MTIQSYPQSKGFLSGLIWRYTAVGGETTLSGNDNLGQFLSYTPGQEQVYLNGVLLVRSYDYVATNGSQITGLAALVAGDSVQVTAFNNLNVASVPSSSITGVILNNQLQNSTITINGTPISLGGSISLPGTINGITAGSGLAGGGTSGTVSLSVDTSVTATLTATQTLLNKTLNFATLNNPTLASAVESVSTISTAINTLVTVDALSSSVWLGTATTTGNFTLNIRGNASTTLNSYLAIGQSITVALIVPNGSTGYYPTAFQIDGTPITPKWQGGITPAAGSTNASDIYTLNIIKTANATYNVYAGQLKFA